MESVKTNEAELTSTMGNLMSTSKNDKTEASDSTPTSSTDAFTASSTSHIAADDPISSTSSDVLDAKKSTDVAQSSTNVMSSNPVASPFKDFARANQQSPIASEKDLLDMNITDTSMEKITENVDDIVQDLENLLGEPTASFDFTVPVRDSRNSSTLEQDRLPMDLDAFSAELQMLAEQTTGPNEIPKAIINQPVKTPKELAEPVKNHIQEAVKIETMLTNTTESITDAKENSVDEKLPEPVSVEESAPVEDITKNVEENLVEENVPKETVQEIESSYPDADVKDSKDTVIEDNDVEQTEEITETVSVDKSEPSVSEVIPFEHPKTEDIPSAPPALEESQCKFVAEIPKEVTERPHDLLSSEENVDAELVVVGGEVQHVEKTDEREMNLMPSAVINDVPIEEVINEEVTTQSEDAVVEVKNQQLVNVEEDILTMKEDCDVSEDVNNLSSVVPEEVKPDEEIRKIESSEDLIGNESVDNLTTKQDEPEVKDSSKSLETRADVQSQEVYAIAPERPAPCEDVTETSESVIKPEEIEERQSQRDETASEVVVKIVNEVEEPMEVAGPPVEEQQIVVNADNSAEEKYETPQIVPEAVEQTQPVEEKHDTSVELPQILTEVTEQTQPFEEKYDTPVELAQVVDQTQPVEEKDDTCIALPQILPEVTEQTQPVEEKYTSIELPQVVDQAQPVAEKYTSVELPQIVDQLQPIEEIADLREKSDSAQLSETAAVFGSAEEPKAEQLQHLDELAETTSEVEMTVGNLETAEILPSEKNDEGCEPASMETSEVQTTDLIEISESGESAETTKLPEIPVEEIGEIVSDVAPVDFIPENTDISLVEDLDLLVQNTINESISSAVASIEEKPEEANTHMPSSTSVDSVDNLKDLDVVENNLLPLEVDVPDLEVLNAISSLSDNRSPDMLENIAKSDALLSSSTLEQPLTDDVPFVTNIDTGLPTVEEIFAEQNQQIDVQDENLETLLAVASLQSVDYSMTPVDDFTPPIEEMPSFVRDEVASAVETVESFVQEATVAKLEEELANAVGRGIKPKEVTVGIEESEVIKVAQEQENNLKEPLVINVEDNEKERVYSPKITIKPIKPPEDEEVVSSGSGDTECSKGSLKMTITKQSDNTHSILKIYDPDHDDEPPEPSVPKLIIKPIVQPNEQPQSPKMSTRSSKQVFSPSSSTNQRSASPRITIKPILKPDELVAPLKITIKPVLKGDESHKQKHSPKLTIKTLLKPEEEGNVEPKMHSPRVTIKPIVKPPEEVEQVVSPRITIKPIVKPAEVQEQAQTTPRLTIKPVVRPSEKEKNVEIAETVERSSPKITIKPIVKPQETETLPTEDFEESIKERIVLKINKGTIPGSSKESRKRGDTSEEEKSEKLPKMKLKFSKGGGHPQIVQDQSPTKRLSDQTDHDKSKRQKTESTEHFLPAVTITPMGSSTVHSKLKEMLSRGSDHANSRPMTIDDDDDVTLVEEPSKASPIVISEESNQDSMAGNATDLRDPISEIPVFEITPDSVKTINPQPVAPVIEVPAVVAPPAPRKRGRPRKVPLQVREDFKDPKEEEPKPVVVESTRPKRSCRGQSVRTTLGIKPRKPRGPGRGRGSKRGMGTRSTPTPPETPSPKAAKEPKLGGTKLKELKEESFLLSDKSEVKTIEIDDGLQKSPSNSLLAPPQSDTSTADRADIVMYEEETRMSAETGSSRAQTPAKQVTNISTVDLVEESQSSVQSTATTESVKIRRGPRLEVHQEPEGAVISADQLAEYFWSGGGPFMLQEQVAQFLGIKSFKRKYPNIARRVVDMQERDFIRESGLAGEAMCDLGLTSVNSSDILDIMYSDFQDKYEEYCKHQRDRQAKDLINKQKALSLAASQEKAKIDITQQAVQSAASWNANFNKARRDQRKSCMDLQTLTIHFPKGKMKQINKPKVGYYPVALVPGQFTDYYGEFTPTEINNLPLTTLCYEPVIRSSQQEMECDSQTDGSGSDSDSSSSDTDSSYSGSSDGEDCTLCKPTPKKVATAAQ